nr:beta-galactosidase [Lacticaseibacillus manihotivorans]
MACVQPGEKTWSTPTSCLAVLGARADSVLYFQWRQSRGASEKFHGAVVAQDGRLIIGCFKMWLKLVMT